MGRRIARYVLAALAASLLGAAVAFVVFPATTPSPPAPPTPTPDAHDYPRWQVVRLRGGVLLKWVRSPDEVPADEMPDPGPVPDGGLVIPGPGR